MSFTLQWLSQPTKIHDQRLPAHSDHRWFANWEECQQQASSFEHDLNGTWDFRYYPSPAFLPEDVPLASLAEESTWESIVVPGHLQLQGYDRNRYTNTQYPWDGWEELQPGQAPALHNPVGVYRRTFECPQQVHADSQMRLRFEGAESALAVWLNGEWVGYSTDSFTPAEFAVTDLLVPGTNTLLAVVFMWHAGSWLEDQDFFRFCGLHRPVSLIEVPQKHVEHLKTEVVLAPDFSFADVFVDLTVADPAGVSARLEDHLGNSFALEYQPETQRFYCQVAAPRLWSAEDPYLYQLLVSVFHADGTLSEVICEKVGMRRFEIAAGLMLLNGRRLVFKGVNRHEFGPAGRVVPKALTTQDLLALKAIGVNAVRTSHYPNSSHFYAECDRLGLYVIDEMNLESHGEWDRLRLENLPLEQAVPGDNPIWLPTLLDRAESMLKRDLNHPCILLWSCGNESYGGSNLLKVADYFRNADSRPVHYEGTFWDPRYPETTDVFSSMYVPAAEIEAYLATHRDKPYIVCEYAHAMGNSFGAVDKYLDLAQRDPLFHGGFIWDFADQAVLAKNAAQETYWAYGGDSGEAPHDGEFCGNGIFFADHSPTPKVQEVKALYAPFRISVTQDSVQITNDMLFTASSNYLCGVTLAKNGIKIASAQLVTDILPGETAHYALPTEVAIPVFEVEEPAAEYTLTVSIADSVAHEWAEAGTEVAFGQATFRYLPTVAGKVELTKVTVPGSSEALELIKASATDAPSDFLQLKAVRGPLDAGTAGALRVVEGVHNIGVHGPQFSMLFSKIYGGPVSYRFGDVGRGPDSGRQLLAVPPRPCFWHAQTSNEKGWNSTAVDGQWLLASRYATVASATENPLVSYDAHQATIRYRYELPTSPVSQAEVVYQVTSSGRVEVTLEVTPGTGLTDMPEFGMLLAAPADLQRLHWYGDGPDECYVDRRNGARLGIFTDSVQRQHTAYLRPQESGNRTGVRWVEVLDEDGSGLRFDSCASLFGMEFSAQPWSPFEVENARHDFELPQSTYTWLRPALMRRGVGGDNSWGARTHPEYCLPAGVPLRFTFAFQGVLSK
ncbi:MAG: glycoside hydrolase family 2 TIM barrel-domain containing protein [Actinomycetaceae bacterium]|nr:glycoside hydrolase family 2 TIM barrel-domain containing protein [Actinomycetaceae bacterium]